MKALRWYGRRDLRYEDVPEPSPGPGQAKVKVSFAGICGSELKEYVNGPRKIAVDRLPLIAGHEFAGTIVEIDENGSGLKVGDRVGGIGNRVCGTCFFCRKGLDNLCLNSSFSGADVDGCMAEYLVTRCSSLYKLPDSVSDEAGALVEPLAVAIHAVRQANIRSGDTVAIVGDGAIGLCVLLAARSAGASAIYMVAKHRTRGSIALNLGATTVIYLNNGGVLQDVRNLTGGLGVDVALECVGSPEALRLSVDLVRRGGMVSLIGVLDEPASFDFSSITFDEKSIAGSSIYINEGKTAVDWMADKRIDPAPLITSVIPLRDAVRSGFEKLLMSKEGNVKVLLQT
jgi:(R,R)-butanediol dehydrogenase / meso-butanediol dehydrogenase / diacetyl reductase